MKRKQKQKRKKIKKQGTSSFRVKSFADIYNQMRPWVLPLPKEVKEAILGGTQYFVVEEDVDRNLWENFPGIRNFKGKQIISDIFCGEKKQLFLPKNPMVVRAVGTFFQNELYSASEDSCLTEREGGRYSFFQNGKILYFTNRKFLRENYNSYWNLLLEKKFISKQLNAASENIILWAHEMFSNEDLKRIGRTKEAVLPGHRFLEDDTKHIWWHAAFLIEDKWHCIINRNNQGFLEGFSVLQYLLKKRSFLDAKMSQKTSARKNSSENFSEEEKLIVIKRKSGNLYIPGVKRSGVSDELEKELMGKIDVDGHYKIYLTCKSCTKVFAKLAGMIKSLFINAKNHECPHCQEATSHFSLEKNKISCSCGYDFGREELLNSINDGYTITCPSCQQVLTNYDADIRVVEDFSYQGKAPSGVVAKKAFLVTDEREDKSVIKKRAEEAKKFLK